MDLYSRLADWSQRLDRMLRPARLAGRSGLGLVLKCIVTGIVILLLLGLVVWLFPSQRHNVRTIMPVLIGLGVGFVYGCNGGPAAWLFAFALIFRAAIWDKAQPLSRNLEYFVLYLAVYYVGFGLSHLAGCRRGAR